MGVFETGIALSIVLSGLALIISFANIIWILVREAKRKEEESS